LDADEAAPAPAAQGAPAPAKQAPAQGALPANAPIMQPARAPSGNYFVDKYGEGDPLEPEPPPPPGPKPHDWSFLKGFVGQSNRLLTLLKRAAAASGAGLAAAEDPTNTDLPALQDELYKRWIEPSVQNQALYDLPKDATFSDKLFHGLGTTAGMIAQAIATLGPAGGATTGALLEAGAPAFAARAAGGVVTMQVPAAAAAVEIGHQVLAETGDKHAAITAGVTSYLINSAQGAIPMGVGGRLATRVATAGGAGVALQEAGRVAQNAAMPESMQQPFDIKEDALAALTTAPFGILGHGAPAPHRPVVEAGPANAMEEIQREAMVHVAAQGGDALDQQVAASHANAVVGAHHDAAAVQGAREAEQAANAMELRRQQAAQADADAQAAIDQGQREQALNQAATEAAPDTTPEQGFARREQEIAQQKEADFSAAKNQQGDQAVEASRHAAIGAQKGGANEPRPTIADALPPEQRAVLDRIKAQRMQEAAQRAAEPGPEPSVVDRMREQAKGTEDDFKELPPAAPPKNRLAAIRAAAEKRARTAEPTEAVEPAKAAAEPVGKAAAPVEEGEQPATNPAPATPQSFKARKQAAVDAAMAEKVGVRQAALKSANAAKGGQVAPTETSAGRAYETTQEAGGIKQGDVVRINDSDNAQHGQPGRVQSIFRNAKDEPWSMRVRHAEGQEVFSRDQLTANKESAATTGMHGQTPALAAKREAAFQQDAAYKNLMAAKPGEHTALVGDMVPEEAQAHLDRLNAAPGDNPAARAALKDRIAAGRADVDAAAHEAATSPKNDLPMPTEAQQHAGNFKMGHTEVGGLPVTIEYPSGSERPAANGETRTLSSHYGFVKGTVGADGQHVDVLVGRHPENDTAFVVDHLDENSAFEQHKVLLGFNTRLAAMRAYRRAFPDNPLGPVSETSTASLKTWLKEGDTTRPYDQRGVNRLAGGRFAEAPVRDANGLQLRRRAAAGDTDAQEELATRARDTAPRGQEGVEGAPENEWFNNQNTRNTAEDVDRMLRPPMNHDEAKGHLSDISDAAGPRSFMVHESPMSDTVPQKLRAQVAAGIAEGRKFKGAYEDGVAHVFADSHKAGDKESLLNTAVHELTHLGLDSFLGEKYKDVLLSVAHEIKDTQWAKKYAAGRNFDLRNPRHLLRLGDEYAAHMAENIAAGRAVHDGLPVTEQSPSHMQRIWDAIRAGLRQLGLVKHWNDNDIAALIRQAQSHIGADPARAAREGAAFKDSGGARFSEDNADKYIEDHFPPDHPMAIGHKLGRTVEEQGKYNPGSVRSVERLVKDLGEGVKPDHILGGIGLRNIPDFIREEKMPNVHGFIDDHDAMEGRRRQILNPSIDLAKEWSQWQAKQDDRGEFLSDLMHASTLTGHDPSKPYVERYTPEEREADPAKAEEERGARAAHAILKRRFEDSTKLDDQGRKIFNRVRDSYDAQHARTLKALEDRINATGASTTAKAQSIDAIRKTFERGKVKGFYAPLQRFGDLWANAKDEHGNTLSFARFESPTQRKQWLAEMRKQGLEVDSGERMDDKSEMQRISPEFVKKVLGHIEAVDPTGSLAKDVWQEYLKALPETSMRKHMITRLGRLGFSGDALRAFAFNSTHGAHQLARLEYGQKLDERLENIKHEARALEQQGAANPDDKQAQSDAKWAPAIAREMQQRYDWLRNPQSSKLASNLTRAGFMWYLGAAPATAFRIFTQNPMIAHPVLAARFGGRGAVGVARGQAMATKELSRASWQWARSAGSLGDTLRGDERRAFEEADQRGVFSDTQTQLMAAGGNGSPLFKGPWYQFQKYAGFMFNAMERHNRMTTLVAGYRLARDEGMGHEAASKLARQLTWDAHFDYTNANRPRYLQGNITRVAGLFKQYSLGVTYRLAREAADMIRQENPEDRAMARHAFGALIGRMMLFAGVTGIPGYWIAEKIVNMFLGDKDKPYDMTAALHKHLNDTMGQTAGDAIMTGPVGAISGASLSPGASYNDLWYKEPMRNETPHEEVLDAIGQLTGPIGAVPINAGIGLGQIYQGNTERGLEHWMPPEGAALMKAVRYATQGATNTAGQNILAPGEEITAKDVALQGLGFTPQKVADAYRRNAAIKNVEQAVMDRRKLLSDKYETALLTGDQKTAAEVWPEIQKFNETNPGMAIGKGLVSGAIDKAKRNATATQGLNLPPGLQNLEQEY
jgi:hypothetical protein